MTIRNLKIARTVSVEEMDLTSSQWDLFTDIEGVDGAASQLNKAFKAYVNLNYKEHYIRNEMQKLMDSHSKFGASDSEPMWMLELLLKEVFGRPDS